MRRMIKDIMGPFKFLHDGEVVKVRFLQRSTNWLMEPIVKINGEEDKTFLLDDWIDTLDE